MLMLTATSCPPATTAPCRRSRLASGSRAIAVPLTAPSTATGAGSAPPAQRRRTRRARRRATAADPPAAAVTIDRRQTEPGELRGRVGEVVRRGVAGGQAVGREPCQVGRQRGRPLRRHGLGVVRQDEHEVVAATERGADLIDGCPGFGVGDDVGHVGECVGRPDDVVVGVDDDAEERGGEDVVGIARHAHCREQVAGGVAPHPSRGGRVLVQEVDDVGLEPRRRGNSSDPVAVADDVRPYSAGGSAGSSATSSSSPLRSRDVSTGAGGPPATSTWRWANSRTNAGASIPADSSVNMAKTKT